MLPTVNVHTMSGWALCVMISSFGHEQQLLNTTASLMTSLKVIHEFLDLINTLSSFHNERLSILQEIY